MPRRQGSHELNLKHACTHIHTYAHTYTQHTTHVQYYLSMMHVAMHTTAMDDTTNIRSAMLHSGPSPTHWSFSPTSPSAHIRTFSLYAPSNIHQGTYLPIIRLLHGLLAVRTSRARSLVDEFSPQILPINRLHSDKARCTCNWMYTLVLCLVNKSC